MRHPELEWSEDGVTWCRLAPELVEISQRQLGSVTATQFALSPDQTTRKLRRLLSGVAVSVPGGTLLRIVRSQA